MTAPLGVALLGVGTVGSAVALAFAERSRLLDQRAGRPLRLIAGVVRDPARPRTAGDLPLTGDPFAVLDDPEVHVVVEAMGGTEPARELHLAAFERGKHVVTANKELLAREWQTLHEAARMARRELRYEASVAAAIPIVAAARQLAAVRPRLLRGLVNGTTTYICSRLEAGASFADALGEAQRAGYAEPDPSADVDGWDAAYKLTILISILQGRYFAPNQVRRSSLREVRAAEVEGAVARGARIRYLAVAEFGDHGISARVGPEEVPAGSLEGLASGPTNVITIETDLAGTLTFSGPGAGGAATASAILGDVVAIARSAR